MWLNVLDDRFNFHLNETLVTSAWVVKKATKDGHVTSLELFDAAGENLVPLLRQTQARVKTKIRRGARSSRNFRWPHEVGPLEKNRTDHRDCVLNLGPVGRRLRPESPRIVSIGGPVTEIVYALGADKDLVGVDTSSIYPEAATKLPQVGYQRMLSAEGVLALHPTLILASADAGTSTGSSLSSSSPV